MERKTMEEKIAQLEKRLLNLEKDSFMYFSSSEERDDMMLRAFKEMNYNERIKS